MKTVGLRGTGRRVDELAAATALTVRTLHDYEEIGLLVASASTSPGRLSGVYSGGDRSPQMCSVADQRGDRNTEPRVCRRGGRPANSTT